MSVGNAVFHILSEFKFETQSAVAEAGVLQSAVSKVSIEADNAITSLMDMGKSFLSQFGMQAGIAGILGMAIKSSESFKKSSLQMSNIIGSNLEHLSGDVTTFNDRLKFSEQTMGRISNIAKKFGLSEENLLASTKNMAAMLIPKGLAGNNLGNAIDLARSFEKSAPTLGVDPSQSQGELMRMIEGSATMNDTLFRRLMAETKAFAGLRSSGATLPGSKKNSSGAAAFNMLPMQARFEMIQKGMAQFSSDGDVLAGIVSLLSSKFQLLKDRLWGLNGILKPLGDAVVPALRSAFDYLLNWLDTKGRKIVLVMADGLKAIADNPERVLATIMQFRELKNDLTLAGHAAAAIGIASFTRFLLSIPLIGNAVSGVTALILGSAARLFAAVGGWGTIMTGLGFAFRLLMFAVRSIFLPLTILLGIFQLISRAIAIAKLTDAKVLAEKSDKITEVLGRITAAFTRMIRPFTDLFEQAAQMISPLFRMTTFIDPVIASIEGIAAVMEGIGTGFIYARAALEGFSWGIWQFAMNLLNFIPMLMTALKDSIMNFFQTGSLDMGKSIADAFEKSWTGNASVGGAFQTGFDSILNKMLGGDKAPQDNAERNVQNNATYINKVEVRQDFKKNTEPDRVAHSLVKTLTNIAKNPTQAANKSQQGALVGG